MKRVGLALVVAVAFATPAVAQEKASGKMPSGWQLHLDNGSADASKVGFLDLGKDNYHITTGPAALFWSAANANMKGPYTITATFTQVKAPAHPEAYGVFIGGKNMDTKDAEYAYLIIRGDGKYSVKHRANATDVHTVQDWTDLPELNKQDAAGKATNTVSWVLDAAGAHALVNGKEVWTNRISGDGVAGLRVNHQLEVHVSDFKVTPAK
ncbi:MAG TPA: hypothetical protein VM100_13230 [Longimicrobiales bacterium]|nr:hypothetical protein [Longimicrobiales bacterium]